jgi:hypothetical protein
LGDQLDLGPRIWFSKSLLEIDKYKWKYWENIFVSKFLRDFIDGNISSVYTEGITVGKKIKTKQKNDDVSFFTNKIIPSVNPLEFSVGIF